MREVVQGSELLQLEVSYFSISEDLPKEALFTMSHGPYPFLKIIKWLNVEPTLQN